MEGLLNQLWNELKSHKVGLFILFLSVLFCVLGVVAVVSDIGFSDEIKRNRYRILYLAIGFAVFYVIVWSFIFIVRENKRLTEQVKKLQEETGLQKKNQEEADKVSAEQAEEITHLRQTILELAREITVGRVFEVSKVQFFKEKLFLTLKKRDGLELNVGSEIRVIDKVEGYVMGVFEVTEVRDAEYLARSGAYISPVWTGYVHQTGNAESSLPPDSIAVYYPKEGQTHE